MTPAAQGVDEVRWTLARGGSCEEPMTVHRVVVRRDGKPVWAFSSTEGRALDHLTYGVLPEGFAVGREAQPIEAGQQLELEVRGAGDEARSTLVVQ